MKVTSCWPLGAVSSRSGKDLDGTLQWRASGKLGEGWAGSWHTSEECETPLVNNVEPLLPLGLGNKGLEW